MKRLLIAHSSESFVSALAGRLTGEYAILCCTDGEETLSALNGFAPHILILHTALPCKDGITVLEQSAHFPELIIVTTNYMDTFVALRLQKLGVAEVLFMPMVSTVVASICRQRERLRELIPQLPIQQILHSLGFRTSLAGYRQLCLAWELIQKNPGRSLSREIYPEVAEILRCHDGRAVEKTIRSAIHTAWREGDGRVWKKYFPGNTCPGNRGFLLALSEMDRNRPEDDHAVFFYGAAHGQDFDPGSGSFP